MSLRCLAALALVLLVWANSVVAQSCTATFTNFNFGTVSLRSGVTNQTSGSVTFNCSGISTSSVGLCMEFADGTGGSAGAGHSPRYMTNANSDQLAYELRLNGNGAANGTLTQFFTTLPISGGNGAGSVPLYADIVSSGVGGDTGNYTSIFIISDLTLTFGVSACNQIGSPGGVTAFTVTAEVTDSCEVDGATLDFGALPQTISAAIDATGQLDVRCTNETEYALRLDLGTGVGVSDPANRKMTNGASELRYGIYLDSARTLPWGQLVINDVDGTGTGSTQSYPVYGRVHAGQSAAPGVSGDTVIVTIEY